jgi:hypothetical protein
MIKISKSTECSKIHSAYGQKSNNETSHFIQLIYGNKIIFKITLNKRTILNAVFKCQN